MSILVVETYGFKYAFHLHYFKLRAYRSTVIEFVYTNTYKYIAPRNLNGSVYLRPNFN